MEQTTINNTDLTQYSIEGKLELSKNTLATLLTRFDGLTDTISNLEHNLLDLQERLSDRLNLLQSK
jgi:hypothetical protein